jgi:hypothetical protein
VPAANVEAAGRVSVPISLNPSELAGHCGVAVHYWGRLDDGTPAQSSVYWRWPHVAYFATHTVLPTRPPAPRQNLLNFLVQSGRIDGRAPVSDSDLLAAWDAAALDDYDPTRPYEMHTRGGAVAGSLLGSACDPNGPGTTTDASGNTATCVLTGWVKQPKVIRNAMAGDVVITRGCSGPVLPILDVLGQTYTHMGIMVRDGVSFRQSSGDSDWIQNEHAFISKDAPLIGLREDGLRYGWPGTSTVPVDQAIDNGGFVQWSPSGDPSLTYGIHGLHETDDCSANIVFSRVIKPLPENEATFRTALRRAAKAAEAIDGHYRFATYSHAPDDAAVEASAPAPIVAKGVCRPEVPNCPLSLKTYGGTPTVCSLFVRDALLNDFSAPIHASHTSVTTDGVIQRFEADLAPGRNGLYRYTEDQRKLSFDNLYAFQYNAIMAEVSLFGRAPKPTDDADFGGGGFVLGKSATALGQSLFGAGAATIGHTANLISTQIVRCFATDQCGAADMQAALVAGGLVASGQLIDGIRAETRSQLGTGSAVSPDNILHGYVTENSPYRGRAGGTATAAWSERAIVGDEVDVPEYTWEPAAGTVPLTVHVVAREGAALVPVPAGILVKGLPGAATTDDHGDVHYAAIDPSVAGRIGVTVDWYRDISIGYDWHGAACAQVDVRQPATPVQEVDCASGAPLAGHAPADALTVVVTGPTGLLRRIVTEGTVALDDYDWPDKDDRCNLALSNSTTLDARSEYSTARLDVFHDAPHPPYNDAHWSRENSVKSGGKLCCDELGDRVDVAIKLVTADPAAPVGSDEREASDHGCLPSEGKTCAILDFLATQYEYLADSCGASDYSGQSRQRLWLAKGKSESRTFSIAVSGDGKSTFNLRFSNLDGDD